jgi:SAM-dependent methyltransferase
MVAWDGVGDGWHALLEARGFRVMPQRAGSLSDRLAGAFTEAMTSDPYGSVLLIGMDTPQVRPELLAVDWEGADAVLGLSEDGGFWAVGLRRANPHACFAEIPMSTARTGAAQLARLVDLGLSVKLLPPLRDVDDAADAAAVASRAPWLRFARCHRELVAQRHRQVQDRSFDGGYTAAEAAVGRDGQTLGVSRWSDPADAVDLMIASRCEPPVLHLGCGPGRLVRALNEFGLAALGVDMSAEAVRSTLHRGGLALLARAEDRLPAEGRWGTVLLMDGNVDMGISLSWLLRRCRRLVASGGLIMCEVNFTSHLPEQAQVLRSQRSSPRMPTRTGGTSLIRLAQQLDLSVAEEWSADERVFVALRKS